MGEAHHFLKALYGDAPDHALAVLWTKDDKSSHYFAASDDGLAAAAQFAESRREDVYTHAALAAQRGPKHRRLSNLTAAGIVGVWADVDINGGPQDKRGAAPDLQTALEVVSGVLEPSLTVTSGYGLQAWWLLDEGPWIFRSDDERERGAALAGAWIRLVRKVCQEAGFTIDAVQDLARVLRVPGTFNAKGKASGWEPARVSGWPESLHEQDGPRYELHALLEIASKAPAPTSSSMGGSGAARGSGGALVVRADAEPPLDKLEALRENSQVFEATWRRARREQVARDWSSSEYDLALCSFAVQAEWEDQELANLIIAHRRRHDPQGLDKALRVDTNGDPDYLLRTIARARTEHRKVEREKDRSDALDELQQVAENGEGDPDRVLSAFNRIVGGPVIKELIQDGRDPETATFTLVMGNGDPVRLGGASNLVNQDRFRERFMVVTARLLPKVKADEWTDAVNALMTTRQLRESSDDTPEGTVLEWLRRYLYERIAPKADIDESATLREPFEREGDVFVFAQSFAAWVRGAMRLRAHDHEVRDMLRNAGFERRTVNYHKRDGQRASASFYAARRDLVDA